MAVIMAFRQRLSTLAVLCVLLCICPTMELDTVFSVSPSPTPARLSLVQSKFYLYGLSCKHNHAAIIVVFTYKVLLGNMLGRATNEDEETFIGDREEKRLQHAQRRHERRVKYDELRRKYGLLQDSDHPYSRYENE
ncbi:Pituitary tumor-transforming 1-like interacting protein [Ophiophagus hannah]|uniref:Pituitary tumor-transforming 1-like interacting protein n=1 Tax=Ophiophagus hannah TaxID=8665 RepID=V8P5R8_OPHHA|nr:Pituitary tumor-transforming 1-like interacting protein [Ophiophagus hannah]